MTKDSPGVISDVDLRHIIRLVEALDQSNFDSLQLDVGGLRLTLGKGHDLAEPSTQVSSVASTVEAPPSPIPPPRKPAREKQSTVPAGDTVDVRSPIMGLFYSKPDPSSSPFVSLGTEVNEGTTVGLVEVMKVFNAIPAGAKGLIVEICVEDSETVEIGQTLFRIRPAAT